MHRAVQINSVSCSLHAVLNRYTASVSNMTVRFRIKQH